MIGASTNVLGIGLAVYLRDHFSGPARGVSFSLKQLQNQMVSLRRQAFSNMGQMGMAGGLVFGAGLAAMRDAVKVGSDFEFTMSGVQAVTADASGSMVDLKKKIIEVGKSSLFSIQEVADASEFMGKQGFGRDQIAQSIKAVTDLGAATGSHIGGKGGAAEIMTNIMHGFSIPTEQIGRVSDILSLAANRSNTDILDMGEALKYTASTSMDLNIGLEETLAAVMALSNAGIHGSMAGTAIENMLRYATMAVSPEAMPKDVKALAQLGLTSDDLRDAQGNLVSIEVMMTKISEGLRGMNNVDTQNILQNIFGVRGKRGGSLLNREGQQYSDFIKMLKGADAGTAGQMAQARMDNMKGSFLLLADSWVVLQHAFEQAIEPLLRFLVDALKFLTDIASFLGGTLVGRIVMITGAVTVLVGVIGSGLLIALGLIGPLFLSGITTAGSFFGATMTGAFGSAAALNAMALAQLRVNAAMAGMGINAAGSLYTLATGRIVATAATLGTAGAAATGAGTGLGIGAMFASVGGAIATAIPYVLAFGVAILFLYGIWKGVLLPAIEFLADKLRGLAEFLGWYEKGSSASIAERDKIANVPTIALDEYLKDPSKFNNKGVKIGPAAVEEDTRTPEEREQTKQQTINLYVNGTKTFGKTFEGEEDEDVYHKTGVF